MSSHFSQMIVHSCDSTMDLAHSIADKQDFFWILSDQQTQGKGSRNRHWESLEGNIHCSVGVHKKYWKQKPIGLLSLYTGVILHHQIQTLLKRQSIDETFLFCKWPNDLLIQNKKIAGILIKSTTNHYLIGIGLNTEKSPTLQKTETLTTSLKTLGISPIHHFSWIEDFLESFKKQLTLKREEFIQWTLEQWRFSHNWNQPVFIRDDQSKEPHTPLAINKEGHLQIQNSLMQKKWLTSIYLDS